MSRVTITRDELLSLSRDAIERVATKEVGSTCELPSEVGEPWARQHAMRIGKRTKSRLKVRVTESCITVTRLASVGEPLL